MMLRSQFTRSKLKQLLLLSRSAYTYTKPISNPIHSTLTPPFLQNPTKTLIPPSPFLTLIRPFSSQPTISVPLIPFSRDGNYDEATCQTVQICPGCGVHMQNDPKLPGYYTTGTFKKPSVTKNNSNLEESSNFGTPIQENPNLETPIKENPNFIIPIEEENLVDDEPENPDVSESNLRKGPVICQRCHWLKSFKRVKYLEMEDLIPEFDFDVTVGKRLSLVWGPQTVVLMVVDAVDFDGSFPKAIASFVSKTFVGNAVPRVVLVVNKIDLLPCSLLSAGFEGWVRTRAREGGASKFDSLHFVSAAKEWGVKNLVDDVVRLTGERGQVWAVGAQNAGKSALINAIGKIVGGNETHLTESPMPGTTLGIVRVEGVLPGQVKMFDTPGVLHRHQLMTRLTYREQKLVLINMELKPRTYRIKAGHSVHIGGLMRLDIEQSSADYIYVTVWASSSLPLLMDKTKSASSIGENDYGSRLMPPLGVDRVKDLGNWVRKEFRISGSWWDPVDIAAAGLGWFSIGLKGEAVLGAWTYEGVDVIVRNAVITQRANVLQKPGFVDAPVKVRTESRRRRKKKTTEVAPTESSSEPMHETTEITELQQASSAP